MNQQHSTAMTPRRQAIILSLFIILAAQINFDVFTSHFLVSTGIILFPVSVFLFQEIPLIPITCFSAVGVFLSRILFAGIQNGFSLSDVEHYFPEMIFYLVYGFASHVYFKANDYKLQGKFCYVILFCMDYLANFCELFVRLQTDAFVWSLQMNILIVALIRTVVLFAVLSGLGHYKFVLLTQEHANRYQRLILLISKLNGEIIWMKKNTTLIEETMAASYKLFSQMQEQNVDTELSQNALNVAKDIHEIKKEYMMILRGISEALDLNLQDDGMSISDLLVILENSLSAAASEKGKQFTLQTELSDNVFTDKHYFLLSIFRNLFNNALEANESDHVILTFTEKVDGEDFLFLVADNGPGIPAENLNHIFKPGFSTKINFETGEINRGLGLNLVRDIIENQLSGSITVASEPGNTIFTIRIPKTELEVVA